MEPLSQLTEDEFEHIEEEIARTAKGRSFLRRFRRQALGAATEEIRTMLEEFRLSWRQQTQALEAANRINVLRQELIEMAASIERARREVAALQPEDVDANRIMTATSELDAIVISTERASFDILNAAERLMELSSGFRDGGADPELCAALDSEVTTIFTACSFQDLTGQRTSKVVNALRYIEQRINAVISIWGVNHDGEGIPDDRVDSREDAHLLSGPQLEGRGVSQNDVDAMFDAPAPPPPPAHNPDAAAALEAVSRLLQAHQAGVEADKSEESGGGRFSQSDIDALLSGDSPSQAPPPPPSKPVKPAKQSDIDALFDAPAQAPATKQDQAGIDALFDEPMPAPKAKAAPAPAAKQDQAGIDALFDEPMPAPKAKAAPAPAAKQDQAGIDALFDEPMPAPKAKAAPAPAARQDQAGIDALFDEPAPKAKPAAAKPAAAPPPPPKPKAKAAEPATASPLDQSAIDALFG